VGQKVHPIGFRLGIYRDWDARWFARDSYGKQLQEDIMIRSFLDKALVNAEVSRIEIEKAGDSIRVIVHSSRPGLVIGRKGQDIDMLKTTLAKKLGKKHIEVSVQEVKNADLDATLIAKSIAEQLVRRVSFKKAMKKAAMTSMRSGAKGIKICCAGRLGGAEIAREEWTRVGSVPLHTLRADIDYGFAQAKTTFGILGVKVWICRGEYQKA
jgi:small subunit ribosomal protein S3